MGELVKRLRDAANGLGTLKSERGDYGLCDEAADRIEALEAENARFRAAFLKIENLSAGDAGYARIIARAVQEDKA